MLYVKLLLVFSLAVSVAAIRVKKTIQKSCIVETDEGMLDLSSLSHSNDAGFEVTLGTGASSVTFYWNPCKDVLPQSCSSTGIQPAEMILESAQDPAGAQCVPAGYLADSRFTVVENHLAIRYAQGQVSFVCKKSGDNQISIPDLVDTPTVAILTGPGACVSKGGATTTNPNTGGNGLSPGSIILIIVLVLVVVYLVGGILFMKFVKKAEGSDVIPNKALWVSLGSNTKNGVCFAVKCGKYTPVS